MALLQDFRGQHSKDMLYDASDTVTAGGTSQLVIPSGVGRTYLFLQNLSPSATLYYEIGSAFATATISGGVVTALTIVNGGFGFTLPPLVTFQGGYPDYSLLSSNIGPSGFPTSTFRPAQATAVLTAGVITSFVITDPGAGYLVAPYASITNNVRDSIGAADPFFGSVARGFALLPFGNQTWETNFVTTDPVAVYSATTGHRFTCKFSIG